MKIQINELETKAPFPRLMKSKDYNTIVLFHDIKKGLILYSEIKTDEVGEYHENWNMEEFENYHGEIIISNDN